ncbi:hypothetical protein Csa_010906 [Cucumis sativus]|uniref:Uncharacterized protein n=1 Tax=Cucumis sativus TaxID=3659 RepID=A0A0A0LAE6_CUCSA|nr:hypothetical protein Csa_010906 [Cucumis sativus]
MNREDRLALGSVRKKEDTRLATKRRSPTKDVAGLRGCHGSARVKNAARADVTARWRGFGWHAITTAELRLNTKRWTLARLVVSDDRMFTGDKLSGG